jgi:hypothetical protein
MIAECELEWQRLLLCNIFLKSQTGTAMQSLYEGFVSLPCRRYSWCLGFGVLKKKRLLVRREEERMTSVVYISHTPGSTR